MNGLLLTNPGALELKDFPPITELNDNDVKIKLIYGGICGSDIGVYKGKMKHADYPVVPGHELIGTIIEKGSNVKEEVGQRVVIMPNSFCGECDNCRAGRTNICPQKKSLGINRNGGFSEEFVISSKYILSIPDALTNEKAILIEPLSVIVHGLKKVTITDQTSVAIIGCGSEGMLAIAHVAHFGADITAIDLNQDKLDKIKVHYKDVNTCLPEEVKGSFDIVIEAAGVKQSFEQGIQILKSGGSMVVIGMAPEAEVPVVQLVRNEQTLYGSIIYNFPDDFQTSMRYLLKEDFNVEPINSRILPVEEYEKAYTFASSGNYGKVILSFEEDNS